MWRYLPLVRSPYYCSHWKVHLEIWHTLVLSVFRGGFAICNNGYREIRHGLHFPVNYTDTFLRTSRFGTTFQVCESNLACIWTYFRHGGTTSYGNWHIESVSGSLILFEKKVLLKFSCNKWSFFVNCIRAPEQWLLGPQKTTLKHFGMFPKTFSICRGNGPTHNPFLSLVKMHFSCLYPILTFLKSLYKYFAVMKCYIMHIVH